MGAGREVVNFAERDLKERKADFLWCKGRTSVHKYYERLDFKPFGEVFDYHPIGPHVIMYKVIK